MSANASSGGFGIDCHTWKPFSLPRKSPSQTQRIPTSRRGTRPNQDRFHAARTALATPPSYLLAFVFVAKLHARLDKRETLIGAVTLVVLAGLVPIACRLAGVFPENRDPLLFPLLMAAVFLSAFKEMTMGALLPVYGVRNGLSESAAAAMLTACYVGALLFQLPIGWLADRMNRYLLLILLIFATLVGALLLPGMVALGRPLMWFGLGLWIGLSTGIYIVAMTIVGQRFRGADLVTANASFGLLWGLGMLVGPFLSGSAMDIWDPHGFPGTLAVVAAVVLAIALVRRWLARGQ